MRYEGIDLDERSRIEQQIDPLTRRQLAGSMLALDALLAAATLGRRESPRKLFDPLRSDLSHARRILSQGLVPQSGAMPWSELDTAAVARTLSQLAEQPEDWVDAYFERREEVDALSEEGRPPRLRAWSEEGFAIRLVREQQSWLASRDGLDSQLFAEALRQVARALPSASYTPPDLKVAPSAHLMAREVLEFPSQVVRAIQAEHVAFPHVLRVRRHRRWVQVVGPRLVPVPEVESFYSCRIETEWGRRGFLFPQLNAAAATTVAQAAVARFRARHASSPELFLGVAVLGPDAVAVLLHEAVAHALEADLLAQSGSPDAAVGAQLGASCLDILDDPAAAPVEVRRTSDDEGVAVSRRWLLRGGAVEQPLADAIWARRCPALVPGAGRRSSRHLPPTPRSSHLELLPGAATDADLLSGAERGVYLPEVSRGSLDAVSGILALRFPYGYRIRRRGVAEPIGPCALRGRVADLLSQAVAVGNTPRSAGAGWCVKEGQKLPVWATSPSLRLEGVALEP
jgi:predicted Zn-dependent protease